MGFQIERRNYTEVAVMAAAIVNDLIDNGFSKIFPVAAFNPLTDTKVTLEAGLTVDPLQATQPWRIQLNWGTQFRFGDPVPMVDRGGFLEVCVGTPIQLPDDGTVARYLLTTEAASADNQEAAGLLGSSTHRATGVDGATTNSAFMFLNRERLRITPTDERLAYPMSYQLTITDRGVALFIWEQASDIVGNRSSWFVVQRPVDHVTGAAIITGTCPVHCMYGIMPSAVYDPSLMTNTNYRINRFVVREEDVTTPYPRVTPTPATAIFGVDATIFSTDYNAVINPRQQVSIAEDNKYMLTFPSGLNTARYAYSHELDMVAYVSADVVSQGTEVPVTVYGEVTPRTYKAMTANAPNNAGMRILMLVEGGGV